MIILTNLLLPTNTILARNDRTGAVVAFSCSQLTRVWRRSLGGTGGESENSAGYSLIE